MADQRRSKKTDKIEVRLSPETKQAFHETCEQQGETASGAIRRLIEEYVARFHQPVIARPIEVIRRSPWWVRAGGVAALVAGGASLAALPSKADPEPVWKISFVRQDVNGDGVLTIDEYLPAHYDGNELDQDGADWFRTAAIKGLQDAFDAADTDLDGEMTKNEFRLQYLAFASSSFGLLDANQDGVVSLEEFSTPEDFFSRATVSTMVTGMAFSQGSSRREMDQMEMLHWVAGDIDVSPSVLTFRGGQVFQKIDADSDGTITLEEFLAR